jgi:hypothetical protein
VLKRLVAKAVFNLDVKVACLDWELKIAWDEGMDSNCARRALGSQLQPSAVCGKRVTTVQRSNLVSRNGKIVALSITRIEVAHARQDFYRE